MRKICPVCGQGFAARRTSHRYCSLACQRKARQKRVQCTCKTCGKFFELTPSRLKRGEGRHCSWACRRKRVQCTCEACGKVFDRTPSQLKGRHHTYCSWECNRKRAVRTCGVCGNLFEVRLAAIRRGFGKYCSTDCADKARERRVELTCLACDKQFTIHKSKAERGRKYCSRACMLRHCNGAHHPNWEGGISFECYTPEFNEVLKEQIRARDGYKCQVCGRDQIGLGRKLDVHHKDYSKANNEPGNLISLCRRCHSKTNGDREYWMRRLEGAAAEKLQRPRQLPATTKSLIANADALC